MPKPPELRRSSSTWRSPLMSAFLHPISKSEPPKLVHNILVHNMGLLELMLFPKRNSVYIMFVIQSSPIFRFLRVSTVIRQDCCYTAAVAVPQRKLQTSLLWYALERRPWHTQAKKRNTATATKKKRMFPSATQTCCRC